MLCVTITGKYDYCLHCYDSSDDWCINIETKITKRYNTIALPVLFSQIPKPNGICMRSLGMPEK